MGRYSRPSGDEARARRERTSAGRLDERVTYDTPRGLPRTSPRMIAIAVIVLGVSIAAFMVWVVAHHILMNAQ
jgi:hypothetical protein